MVTTLFKFVGTLVFACVFVSAVTAAPQRLKWRKNTIDVAISDSLLENGQNLPPKAATLTALKRAFEAWEGVTNVTFRSTVTTMQSVDPPGPRGDGVSLITNSATYENQILFPKDVNDAAARTRVFYDGNGTITEADIVLNPFIQFTEDGGSGTFDLQATFTHELGHLLGLDHSDVLGSTMGANGARNGLFGLSGYYPRTLSLSDIASIRSLYGSPSDDVECCAKIGGRLTLKGGKAAVDWFVWIQDVESGRVTASARTGVDGSFTIGGVEIGPVKVFAEPRSSGTKLGFESIGEFSLSRGSVQRIEYQIKGQNPELSLSYVGFESQLARSAVVLNVGNSYKLFISGQGVNPETVTITTSSPFVRVTSEPVVSGEFNPEIPTVSFDVEIDTKAPEGDYSVFVTKPSGYGLAMVGSLTVEKFANIITPPQPSK